MSFNLGIENLGKNRINENVALLTNASGVTQNLEQNVEFLIRKGFRIRRIFTAEHGFYGTLNDGDDVKNETYNGIDVVSIYSADRKSIKPEELEDVDTVIYDLQDAGTRPYTFISSLKNLLITASELGKKVVVCDRPNPLSNIVDGPVLKKEFVSFVGADEFPLRYGMTIGELAQFMNRNIGADLNISKMTDYDPSRYYDNYMKYYVPPSLNLNSLDSMFNFSGMVLMEAANVSVGRGTPYPFMQFGLEDPVDLRSDEFEGVILRKTSFISLLNPLKEKKLIGYFIHIKDKKSYSSIRMVATIMKKIYDMDKNLINLKKLNLNYGSDEMSKWLEKNEIVTDLYEKINSEISEFMKIRKDYSLYRFPN
ncbi:MAG: DUF1343 domain-containing protein [Candidatus Thermoplasmatota archaeon]|jgi:uncharacterized protein YbbC (DUF1343 family)|nr:DUF1343 domain-containing protein [Cuniculiplasma sp.]MCL4320427.1 DUF1343 domain-containing protein [Candidatus Thermoplasmatota archaeon]HIH60423.1 DUF1343 domain-containing protein [Ferroplasma sp.]